MVGDTSPHRKNKNNRKNHPVAQGIKLNNRKNHPVAQGIKLRKRKTDQ